MLWFMCQAAKRTEIFMLMALTDHGPSHKYKWLFHLCYINAQKIYLFGDM